MGSSKKGVGYKLPRYQKLFFTFRLHFKNCKLLTLWHLCLAEPVQCHLGPFAYQLLSPNCCCMLRALKLQHFCQHLEKNKNVQSSDKHLVSGGFLVTSKARISTRDCKSRIKVYLWAPLAMHPTCDGTKLLYQIWRRLFTRIIYRCHFSLV